jgi:hypothetical protein
MPRETDYLLAKNLIQQGSPAAKNLAYLFLGLTEICERIEWVEVTLRLKGTDAYRQHLDEAIADIEWWLEKTKDYRQRFEGGEDE